VRILFDHSVPRPLRNYLRPHVVLTAQAQGWDRLRNGALLKAAEEHDFDVVVTADKNMQHQQNIANSKLAVVVLSRSKGPDAERCAPEILRAIDKAKPGSYTVVLCD
jgi:hypothetical protein